MDISGWEKVGDYGVSFLDEYLGGIRQSDFILLGANSGAGKSQLAYNLAYRNAQNLSVALFALEADKGEPDIRELHKLYVRETGHRLSLGQFVGGGVLYPDKLEALEEQLAIGSDKLHIIYREKEFTKQTLIDTLNTMPPVDMIVLDHIDYFDIEDGINEFAQTTEIMKILRQINLDWQIPVVVVTHLRKKGNRRQLLPDLDDIYGTGNKAKQAKTVIFLSPDYEHSIPSDGVFSTFITVPKSRLIGACPFVGIQHFLSREGRYSGKYHLGYSKNWGESVEEVTDRSKVPSWAESVLCQ